MDYLYKANTLKELVQYGATQYGQQTAFEYKKRKAFVEVLYQNFYDDINGFGTYLYNAEVKGKKVAIIGENSYQWLVSFFALANSSNIAVPMDKELDAVTLYGLIKKCDCKVILYSKSYKNTIRRIMEINERVVEEYICISHLEEYIEDGKKRIQQGYKEYLNEKVEKEDSAAIYFTSGTTGDIKGVLLSHQNLCADMYGSAKRVQPEKSILLILPLNHTFSITASVLSVLIGGKTIYICNGVKSFFRDIQEVKTNGLVVVPLFIETMHKSIFKTIYEEGRIKQYRLLCKINSILLKIGIDKRRKLFHSIIQSFGGKLDFIISGGAPISEGIIQDFSQWGIDVWNGYGITECSPVVAVNNKEYNRALSVGKPLEGVNVKIFEPNDEGIGEVCISGETVMKGYYNDETQTASAIKNGWYHTGDIGYLDEDGYLFLTGRIKNLIILANGENISPEFLESKLKEFGLVEEVIVYGENEKIVAEVYPNKDYIEAKNIVFVEEELKLYVAKLNQTLPVYQRIKQVIIRKEEFKKNTNRKIIRDK